MGGQTYTSPRSVRVTPSPAPAQQRDLLRAPTPRPALPRTTRPPNLALTVPPSGVRECEPHELMAEIEAADDGEPVPMGDRLPISDTGAAPRDTLYDPALPNVARLIVIVVSILLVGVLLRASYQLVGTTNSIVESLQGDAK